MGETLNLFRRLIHRYFIDRRKLTSSGMDQCMNRHQITLLLDQLPLADRKQRREIETALTTLLPKVENEQSSHFTRVHMRTLYRGLQLKTANRNPDFVIAILRALEILGDSEAPLTTIASLAFAHPTFVHDTRVSDAAGRCHAILEARKYQTQWAGRLLRAVDSPSHTPDTLLRPTGAAPAEDPAHLVRTVAEE